MLTEQVTEPARTTINGGQGHAPVEKRRMRRRGEVDQQPRLVTEVETLPTVAEQPKASRPTYPLWRDVLAKYPRAGRVEVALVVAFIEFGNASQAELGQKIGVSARTVSRIMARPEWWTMAQAYSVQMKDIGHMRYRAAMAKFTERVADRAATGQRPDKDDVAFLNIAGRFYGDVGAETQVNVASHVNVVTCSVKDLVEKAMASGQNAGQRVQTVEGEHGK